MKQITLFFTAKSSGPMVRRSFFGLFFALLQVCYFTPAQAQIVIPSTTIQGTVKDTDGKPLAGVYVMLEETNFGTVTNNTGEYTLQIPEGTSPDSRIVYSLLGMKKQTIRFDNKTRIDMTLQEDVTQIEDVVVTGYQTVSRRDMVGAYTQLKLDDIFMPSVNSIDEMLQGQVAGMVVTQSSVRAGSAPKITIRGGSTVIGNTSPLWVVDGIIQQDVADIETTNNLMMGDNNAVNEFLGSQISWLNPNDIESITVLKDASATALYGARASNGVIVITTKKGKAGEKMSIRYSANFSMTTRPTYEDYYLMNSQERIHFSQEAYAAGAYYSVVPKKQMHTYEGLLRMYLDGDISTDEFSNRYSELETVNTDWLKLLTRSSFNQNHNISISGASEKIYYTASAGYSNQKGVEKGNESDKMTARVRLGFDLGKKTKLDVAIAGTMTETDGFVGSVNPQNYAITTSRAIPAYENDGSLLYYLTDDDYQYNSETKTTGLPYNIINEIDNTWSKIKTPTINANMTFAWDFLPKFRYEFVAGYSYSNRTSQSYAAENSYYVLKNFRGYRLSDNVLGGSDEYNAALLPFGGQIVTDITEMSGYNIQNKISYSTTINSEHRISVLGAWEVKSSTRISRVNTAYGYIREKGRQYVEPNQNFVPKGSVAPPKNGIFQQLYRNGLKDTDFTQNDLSAFGVAAYSYKDRYVLNANFRNDVSNQFGRDVNRTFDPTWSFGAMWRISEENFMAGIWSWLNYLALRGTYGIQGNVINTVGPQMTLQTAKADAVYGQYISTINRLDNPTLRWEKTHSYDIGLDFSLFNDLVSGTLEYYNRESNAMTNIKMPDEYGTSVYVPRNGTHIDNRGFEVTLSFMPIRKRDFSMMIRTNFSHNWNKVTKMVDDVNATINATSFIQGQNDRMLEKGKPLGGFWAYDFTGLNPETGYPEFNLGDNPEWYTDYLVYAGNSNPAMTGGFDLKLRYKQLSFSAQFAAILGGKEFLPNVFTNFPSGNMPKPTFNLNKDISKRWKQTGDEQLTDIPAIYTGGKLNLIDPMTNSTVNMYDAWGTSTARLVSSSFLRCRQLQLAWYSPDSLNKTLGISSFALTATASNLFVLASSKYNGMDPETGTSILPKTFTLGISLGF